MKDYSTFNVGDIVKLKYPYTDTTWDSPTCRWREGTIATIVEVTPEVI